MARKVLCAFMFVFVLCGSVFAETRARFLFIGDIMIHQQQLDAARHRNPDKRQPDFYDFGLQFRRIRPLLVNSFLVGNLETTFAGTGKRLNYSGYPMFNTPDEFTDTLNDLEIDLLTLANNHIFDRGSSGARRTTEVLDSADLKWTGLGLDDIPANDAVLLENNGISAAFVNWTYGSNLWPKSNDIHLNTISEEDIREGIERAKTLSPDVIVALFHWGNEYHVQPNVHQKRAADWAFDFGADLIVGTHPHVLQPVEVRIDDARKVRAVAWSLGNFVSFQRTLPRERTCILSVEFVKSDDVTRIARISIAPLYVIAPGQKRTEVTYAGRNEDVIAQLDFSGLSKSQLNNLHSIGKNVLEFLGAQDRFDEYGFNVLWDEGSFDVLPVSRRKSPK